MRTAELSMVCSWQPRRDRRSADVLSAGEGLDDEHRGAAMPADEGGSVATVNGAAVAEVSRRRGNQLWQQFANGRDAVLAVGVGEQAVVADAMKAGG